MQTSRTFSGVRYSLAPDLVNKSREVDESKVAAAEEDEERAMEPPEPAKGCDDEEDAGETVDGRAASIAVAEPPATSRLALFDPPLGNRPV